MTHRRASPTQGPGDERSDRRARGVRIATVLTLVVAGLGFVLNLTNVAGFLRDGSPTDPRPTPTGEPAVRPTPSEQFTYQATVHDGRRDLFEGQLYVRTDQTVKVAEWFTIRVLICGPANSDELCSDPAEPTGVGATPRRPPPA